MWSFTSYTGQEGTNYKPSLCHPLYRLARDAYMLKHHGAHVERVQRTANLHFDFGGMIRTDKDKASELQLCASRTFSCWDHQTDLVEIEIESAEVVHHGRYSFHRLYRWPGTICFITKTDRAAILRWLKRTAR